MEGQHPISERKNMDNCLRRLKQELLSMKEAGDGLHAQMNSMMGALQELKLLQVQTALEQLQISGKASKGTLAPGPLPVPLPHRPAAHERAPSHAREERRRAQQRGRSLDTSPTSSPDSGSFPLPQRPSRHSAPWWREDRPEPMDLNAILHSLSREGPSLDSDYSQDGADDPGDWTSSLMSRSRNRQPLVLGDNIFADLVGNWLDLPELEDEGPPAEAEGGAGGGAGDRVKVREEPAHALRLSRSQEICRKFSLTANIFRKLLRSVRPDKDRLLKEKPGWMPLEDPEAELCKRPKKATKPKATFYLPFRTGGGGRGQQGKGRPCSGLAEDQAQLSGVYIGRPNSEFVEKPTPVFDYSTAVWV
ncbi:PAK4-inhibitor INKA2 [Conger conger]|uniref:PAK4-inhibitor INKA2 n=1 Tax=Conger conger TaxID=82655 RepID=UPI002A59E5C5|nr:PAK4-inhibitor INKA2 [Conger conger]